MNRIKKTVAILAILALISALFIGCTPKDETQNPSAVLPDIKTDTTSAHDTNRESEQATIPSVTNNTIPSGGTAEASNQASEEAPDPDGLEIESDATYEIGDNQGFGGN